jgi:hypothetical protein
MIVAVLSGYIPANFLVDVEFIGDDANVHSVPISQFQVTVDVDG